MKATPRTINPQNDLGYDREHGPSGQVSIPDQPAYSRYHHCFAATAMAIKHFRVGLRYLSVLGAAIAQPREGSR